MEYKGFKFNSGSECSNGRMKGIVVYLLDNDNGTYGFVEYGRDFGYTVFDENMISDSLEELIIKLAVDKALIGEKFEKDCVKIKFSSDFLMGIISTIDLLEKEQLINK
ncbi:MAG: hypothetical protein ABF969_11935 [Sporolactobacillus sp.]